MKKSLSSRHLLLLKKEFATLASGCPGDLAILSSFLKSGSKHLDECCRKLSLDGFMALIHSGLSVPALIDRDETESIIHKGFLHWALVPDNRSSGSRCDVHVVLELVKHN